ncbi:MAG: hypothetical protein M3N51_09620 [Actinomycetota bacterium]|nr:hypothetical protein [Actinomycetota bacterium]
MVDLNHTAFDWLLVSEEPAIRFLARRDLLGEETAQESQRILEGPKVATLLAGQRSDGGFGVHPYRKWTGAHWRLVSLVELSVPQGEPRAVRATQTVLDWLTSYQHRSDSHHRRAGPPLRLSGGERPGGLLSPGAGR